MRKGYIERASTLLLSTLLREDKEVSVPVWPNRGRSEAVEGRGVVDEVERVEKEEVAGARATVVTAPRPFMEDFMTGSSEVDSRTRSCMGMGWVC